MSPSDSAVPPSGAAPAVSAFGVAFAATIGHEGSDLDQTQTDRGNWTGGAVGRGRLVGSKFGISAAAYPDLDIGALTLADAEVIYRRDYWTPIRGDDLPGPLAVMVFDAAVNAGVEAAARLLQVAVRAPQDGVVGPVTLAQVARWHAHLGIDGLCVEFLARRIVFDVHAPEWSADALGWAHRLAAQPYDALRATVSPPSTTGASA